MKHKILVVDDEPDALEVLGFKLREAGCLPMFAADGIKALAAVKAERPDLIVLDLMLPEQSARTGVADSETVEAI